MAGPTKSTSQFTYVNIFKGKFVIRCDENDPDPDKRKRLNQLGETIYEIPYGKLEDMMLADVREAEHEQYGGSWEFIMEAGNQYYNLRIGKKSPVSSMILNRLENIQLDKPFTLTVWQPEEDKNVITIWQGGEKVERAHTKENPNGLPQPKVVKVSGVDTWDWTEPLAFYSEMVKSLKPHMPGVNVVAQQVAQAQAETPPPATTKGPAKEQKVDGEIDDLPF